MAVDAGKARFYTAGVRIVRHSFFGLVLGMAAVWMAIVSPVGAAVVEFHDGRVMKDVTVEEKGESVVVRLPEGFVQFPRTSVRSIDGRLLDPPPAPVAAPAAPLPVQPATPPLPSAPTPEATPDAAPVATTEVAPDQAPAAGEVAAPPAPVPPAPAAPGQPARTIPVYEHLWNFEGLLLGLLVFFTLWMRSLQWVQEDLFERRSDPRLWSMAALVLPLVGAGAYAAVMAVSDRAQRAAASKPAPATPPAGGKFGWLVPRSDPNAYLAKKGRTRKGFEFLDTERQSYQMDGGDETQSGLDFASELLEEALLERASDVHIEPTPDACRVRFRLDGIMHERMSYDVINGRRLVTSLKTLAEIDVAEKRKAQDGRFRARLAGREVDFRVATANSIHGEKMVIRILDHSRGVFDLTSLGMSDAMLEVFQGVIHSRSGMILATGPTGSGKTSTLYAALRQLDATRHNIMTIEDPAEYELAGATQIAVNVKAGITYESGLRSILRQDPDVILVGEMRDVEATQVALRAALTGHLMFSSLHTKDAVGTVSRLQDMGIERYQVASALLMIVSQRLVRVLCPHCRQAAEAKGDELVSLGISLDPGTAIYTSVGCDKCLKTGFQGRTGIFELLVLDEDLRRAVSEGADESALLTLALEKGFRSYRLDGAEKVLLGITTIEEVLQAG